MRNVPLDARATPDLPDLVLNVSQLIVVRHKCLGKLLSFRVGRGVVYEVCNKEMGWAGLDQGGNFMAFPRNLLPQKKELLRGATRLCACSSFK